MKPQKWLCPSWNSATLILNQSLVASYWNFTTRNIIKPTLLTLTTLWINSNVTFDLCQRLRPTLTTTKWQAWPKRSNSTWEVTWTIPYIGKTLPLSAEEEDNTLQKNHCSPNKSPNNLAHMTTSSNNCPKNQSQSKDQAGDGLLGTTSQNHWESLILQIKRCWLLKALHHFSVIVLFINSYWCLGTRILCWL